MNCVQQAKTNETKKREIDRAEAEDLTHCKRAKTVLPIFEPERGVFIRELHPLLPGEQPALWAKLNWRNFRANTKYEH